MTAATRPRCVDRIDLATFREMPRRRRDAIMSWLAFLLNNAEAGRRVERVELCDNACRVEVTYLDLSKVTESGDAARVTMSFDIDGPPSFWPRLS